ncbi:alpha kinase/elongation factor 2 kinase [Anaeramoeba flamelloides]|uniref:Alpha kinase/elongation factor 2 kinase n=1 Tax=Anaeramoeba flamelloides TaxID=1746091 RepID=A0AAV7YUN5_9EUKA|nr:alpha kinase/elongation factor 2 kinase [Anaeramoeba flamelloides]
MDNENLSGQAVVVINLSENPPYCCFSFSKKNDPNPSIVKLNLFNTDDTPYPYCLVKKSKIGDHNSGSNLLSIDSFGSQAIKKYEKLKKQKQKQVKQEEEKEREKQFQLQVFNQEEDYYSFLYEEKNDENVEQQKATKFDFYELVRDPKLLVGNFSDLFLTEKGSCFKLEEFVSIFFLKIQEMAQSNTNFQTLCKSAPLKWVVSVPCNWNVRQRNFLYNFSKVIGIKDPDATNNFIVVPESFGVVVGATSSNNITELSEFNNGYIHVLNSKQDGIYLSVIQVNSLMAQKDISLRFPYTFPNCGYKQIEKNIINFLKKFLNLGYEQKNYKFYQKLPNWHIFNEFIKIISPNIDEEWIFLPISDQIIKGAKLKDLIKTWNQNKSKKSIEYIIENKNPRGILITNKFCKSFVNTPILSFCEKLQEFFKMYKQTKGDAKFLIQTGNFTFYNFFSHIVEKQYTEKPWNQQNIILKNYQKTSLNGLIKFSNLPKSFNCKIYSKFTYGLLIYPKYDTNKHKIENKIQIGEEYRCKNVFLPLIIKGSEIKEFYNFQNTCISMDEELIINLYKTTQQINTDQVNYIDENYICVSETRLNVDTSTLPKNFHPIGTSLQTFEIDQYIKFEKKINMLEYSFHLQFQLCYTGIEKKKEHSEIK